MRSTKYNPELVKVFKDEAQDLINKMKENLSFLKNDIGDTQYETPNTDHRKPSNEQRATSDEQRATIHELFRCAHTLRGSAGCVGFDRLGEIASISTEIFRAVKDGKLKLNDIISLLSEGVEICQKLLEERVVINYSEFLERLREVGQEIRSKEVKRQRHREAEK